MPRWSRLYKDSEESHSYRKIAGGVRNVPYTQSIRPQPQVICSDRTMGIRFIGPSLFTGRLFASRSEDDPGCVEGVRYLQENTKFEVDLKFLPCGIKSRRLRYPKEGVEYYVTIVASHDVSRMTEDDEMYTIACRYYAVNEPVGTVMQVTPYTKSFLIGESNAPQCEYSIHLNNATGPSAGIATVGDTVYHGFKCDAKNFAVKVSECFVHDNNDKKYLLIDEKGCSKDPAIISDIMYGPGFNYAFATSRAFKFTDTTKMYFNCVLRLCPLADAECRKDIPPKCGVRPVTEEPQIRTLREKRFSSLRNSIHQLNVDQSKSFARDMALTDEPPNSSPVIPVIVEEEGQRRWTEPEYDDAAEAESEADSVKPMQDSVIEKSMSDEELKALMEDDRFPDQNRAVVAGVPQHPIHVTATFAPLSTDPTQPPLPTCSGDEGYGKIAFVILVVCNIVTLLIATTALYTLFRRRFSAKFSITNSTI